jgi:hypothetical protein
MLEFINSRVSGLQYLEYIVHVGLELAIPFPAALRYGGEVGI